MTYSPCLCRALRLHPDKGGDPELFKEVTHAYVLIGSIQRLFAHWPC